MASHTAFSQGHDPAVRRKIEENVGILHFVAPKEHGWDGVLRKRYTDFQVHEITKDGEVLHLLDYSSNVKEYESKQAKSTTAQSGNMTASDQAAQDLQQLDAKPEESKDKVKEIAKEESIDKNVPNGQISAADAVVLAELCGQATVDDLTGLYGKIIEDPKVKLQESVGFPAIQDREARTRIHTEVRRIFNGKIDTVTGSDGIIQAKALGRSKQKWGNRGQNQGSNHREKPSGKYLHFSLYKENRDTMEAVGQIARTLNMKPNQFSFAGTKDRRAVTVQRISIRSRDPAKLFFINNDRRLNGVKVGDFKYEQNDLYLGCHGGNEFTIVMKDCSFSGAENEHFERQLEQAQSTINTALDQITRLGFINYFGTQRFGTFEIGTQIIGTKLLKGDFEGAVQDLLSYDSALAETDISEPKPGEYVRYDDINRAKALAHFQQSKDAQAASKMLPRRCNTEFNILRHLGNQSTDYIGAMLSIPRNLRNMYLHAYQSLVWNFAASKRWEMFGMKVVKGDLVLSNIEITADKEMSGGEDEETIHLRADGNEIEPRQEARILTAEDVESGKYSIDDVVLPSPGFDVIYPGNEVSDFYKEFMGKAENGSLDPYDMKRRQKDFSLCGAYRKIMGKFIGTPTGSVREYSHDTDQLVPTDLDLIHSQRKAKKPRDGSEAAAPDVRVKRVKVDPSEDSTMEVNQEVPAPVQEQTMKQEEEAALPVAEKKKIAVIFKFALNSSQYATVALRELQG